MAGSLTVDAQFVEQHGPQAGPQEAGLGVEIGRRGGRPLIAARTPFVSEGGLSVALIAEPILTPLPFGAMGIGVPGVGGGGRSRG